MRIEEYQDEQMAWYVQRRFDAYGAVGQQKSSGGVRPADAQTSTPGMIPEVVRMRAREVHLLATSRNRITLQLDEAGHRVAGGHQGPQVDGPRLPGLRLRRPERADEGGHPRLPPPQRADLLHRHPGAAGSARRLHRRLRPTGRGPGRGGRPRRPHPRGRGLGGPRPRHRRLRGQELERPHRRDPPRLERVEGVLPARLQPDRPAPGRQVPQDRGQGPAAEGEGPERARPARLLRAARRARWRRARSETPTPPSATPSTLRSRSPTCRCACRASSSTRWRSTS